MNGASVETTQRVTADNGIEYAYRDLGDGDVPLVLLQHFRGNLDNWDPALIDELAADRRVVTFDNVGVGATTGTTPNTVEAMAHGAIAFLEAMNLQRVDLLGFSLGSFVAQEIALIRPDLLRRVVLASSAPQGAAGMHGWAPDVIGAVGQPETSAAGIPQRLLRPHGHESSRRASRPPGGSSARTTDRDEPTTWQTRQAQYDAVCAWGIPNHSLLQRVAAIDMPGLRRQRRQRPDDPAPLLAPPGGAPPERAGHDLPGLGARLPLPAPQPSSPPTCTPSSRTSGGATGTSAAGPSPWRRACGPRSRMPARRGRRGGAPPRTRSSRRWRRAVSRARCGPCGSRAIP